MSIGEFLLGWGIEIVLFAILGFAVYFFLSKVLKEDEIAPDREFVKEDIFTIESKGCSPEQSVNGVSQPALYKITMEKNGQKHMAIVDILTYEAARIGQNAKVFVYRGFLKSDKSKKKPLEIFDFKGLL